MSHNLENSVDFIESSLIENKTKEYDASSITVLEGLQAVRE